MKEIKLKLIYDEDTKFIVDVVNSLLCNVDVCIEKYDISNYKDKKKALPIMTKFGTRQVPLLVFENEKGIEYTAIWNETSPNWIKEIKKILKL